MDETTDILTTGSLTEATVPPEVMSLARDLAKVHGPVHIASEASGLHVYIADPDLLMTDGPVELSKRHLAINAEKYVACFPDTKYPGYRGRYSVDANPCEITRNIYRRWAKQGKAMPCAQSMKTKKKYDVDTLLQMPPLSVRSSQFANIQAKVITGALRKNLVQDANGVMVPDWVGETTPLSELEPDHPCIVYLRKRGLNPYILEDELGACYCHEAKPEDRSVGRYYSKLPGGMRNCPQGRLIIPIMMRGSRVGYQCRLIDKVENGSYYVWSDQEQWELIYRMQDDGTIWYRFPTEEGENAFKPHKYINALGSLRNELLLGFDNAIAHNAGRPFKDRYCVLCEGPLDAAKLRAPAIAILGGTLSQAQAKALMGQFGYICTCMDTDAAGQRCLQRINQLIPDRTGIDVKVPDGHKDAGELSYAEAAALIAPCDPLAK